MTNDTKYVVQSLELHLFFARIMKEHSIFLEAGFTQKDADFASRADWFKKQFETVLDNAVQLSSNGIISNNVLSSGEIITDFTIDVEQKTQKFTGIRINHNITTLESKLYSRENAKVTLELTKHVKQLNSHTKMLVANLIKFKEKILKLVLSGDMFTLNYPLLIEHIIREAQLYQSYLYGLDKGQDLDNIDIRQTELFWDQIMMEHALFIRGLLDPTESDLIITANNFVGNYEKLFENAQNATDLTIKAVTNETLTETLKFKDFKAAGTKGISECKIRSVIVPLLADHVLRESNHFIRILKSNKY